MFATLAGHHLEHARAAACHRSVCFFFRVFFIVFLWLHVSRLAFLSFYFNLASLRVRAGAATTSARVRFVHKAVGYKFQSIVTSAHTKQVIKHRRQSNDKSVAFRIFKNSEIIKLHKKIQILSKNRLKKHCLLIIQVNYLIS